MILFPCLTLTKPVIEEPRTTQAEVRPALRSAGMDFERLLNFFYADSMQVKHEFALYDVVGCAESFGVFDYGLAGMGVGVNEVGDIAAGAFEGAVVEAMGWNEQERYLFAKIGDKAGALHQLELAGSLMLLFGSMAAGLLSAVFVLFGRGSAQGLEFVNGHFSLL